MRRYRVYNADGQVLLYTTNRDRALAYKRSYDKHPSNFGRRLATIMEA